MKKNRKVVLKGNKKTIAKYNLEKIFDKSLEFIGFAIGITIVMFFINSVKDLYTYFEDKSYLLQLLKNENVEFITTNVCYDFKEKGNNFTENSECNAKDILRKRIDDNMFGFLLSDKLKQDKSYKITDKLIPLKDANSNLKKTLSSQKELEETKISSVKKETKISGCLEGDCINNFSKKNYSNGHYIGEFKNKKEDGQGTYFWNDGDKYIGEWKDGDKSGHGTYTWANGDKYIGEWKDGNRTGQGTFTWASGGKYIGEWRNGNRHGLGTQIYSSGDKYIGEFEGDEKHGQGSWYLTNGDKFEGEWKFNERNGEGIYIWANSGNKYIGSYLDNKRTGRGTFIWQDNTIYVGSWRDNEMLHGIQTNPDGKKLLVSKIDGKTKVKLLENNNQAQKVDLLIKQLKRKNDLQSNRMLLDISKSLMGTNQNNSSFNLNNSNYGGGWLSGSTSSGMYKTCSYTSSLGTKTKTVFASAPCSMAY